MLLEHSRRLKPRLRRPIPRRNQLVKARIPTNKGLHRSRPRHKLRQIHIVLASTRRRREQVALQRIRIRRGWIRSRSLGVTALHLADDKRNPVRDVVTARSKMEQESTDLIDELVGGVIVAQSQRGVAEDIVHVID